MPTEIYIAVLVASFSILTMAVAFVVTAIHFKNRMNAMEKNVAQTTTELTALIQDTRVLVKEVQQVTSRVSKQLEDVEHITRTARGWTDRAERVINAVGAVAEPPLFFLSKLSSFGGMLNGALQSLLARI